MNTVTSNRSIGTRAMALDVCSFLGYTKKQSINYAEDFTKQKRNTSTINIINISKKKKKQKVVDPTIKK